MKVILNRKEQTCQVIREKGDRKFYGVYNAQGESKLLHAAKKELKKQGYDLIKKRMWKDGHLVDDIQQYIRTRKIPGFCIYNRRWSVRGAEEDYNSKGEVTLAVVDL